MFSFVIRSMQSTVLCVFLVVKGVLKVYGKLHIRHRLEVTGLLSHRPVPLEKQDAAGVGSIRSQGGDSIPPLIN